MYSNAGGQWWELVPTVDISTHPVMSRMRGFRISFVPGPLAMVLTIWARWLCCSGVFIGTVCLLVSLVSSFKGGSDDMTTLGAAMHELAD